MIKTTLMEIRFRTYLSFFRCLLLMGSCLFSSDAYSQYEGLLNKTYAQRVARLWQIGDSVMKQPDSTSAFKLTTELATFARKHNDAALELEAEIYAVYYLMRKDGSAPQSRIVISLESIIKRAIDTKSWAAELKARSILATYYWGINKFELALEKYNELVPLLKPVTTEEYPEKIRVFYYIGKAYYSFKDYEKAILYFSEVPRMKPVERFQNFAYIQSINHMANAYRQIGRLDSSDFYLNLLYRYAEKINDTTWMTIVKGDQGHNEYLRGHYDQAIPLLKICIDQAILKKDWSLGADMLMTLAQVYFRQNKNGEAFATTLQAKDFTEKTGQYDRYKTLYPLLAKTYTLKGQLVLAAAYVDSSAFVEDSLDRKFSGLLLARVLQKDAIMEQKAKLADIESRKKILTLKFYAFLVLAIILFGLVFYVYRNKRLQHKREQALKDQELKEKETALLEAQAHLQDFTDHLSEKNKLIEELETQRGNKTVLEELEHSVILTGKDWGRFRELFEKVHPGWLQRLTDKIPNITPSEIRLMTLARLNFSNKEMASALGVSPQAIRVTWHRLRKKSGLADDITIEELVNKV